MSKAVIGIATTVAQAERILDLTQNQAGVAASEISVITPDGGTSHDVGHEKATKAPEGATSGAIAGGLTGGTLGLLAGLGALAIPGLGAFVAAGPIMAALAGAAAGGATGGLIGALVGLGIPEYEARAYQDKLTHGNYLIAVQGLDGDKAHKVSQIFKDQDAHDVSVVGESKP